MKQFLAVTSRGLEHLLADEITELGGENVKIQNAGVRFSAPDAVLYRCCLFSRMASRFIWILSEFSVKNDLDLYLGAQAVRWPTYFHHEKRIVVDFNGTNSEIRHNQYGALKVKDAIVDSFTRAKLPRPSIDKEQPDLRIHARLIKEKLVLGIDVVGASLHQRGYRTQAGAAPLKETCAAALVKKSGWQPGTPLLDPMCGSGTLLIEAALMAAQIAPGLKRKRWGFTALHHFDAQVWQEQSVLAAVQSKRNKAQYSGHFYGFDSDSALLAVAKANAARAGVADLITFAHADATSLERPQGFERGTILCNPPYGERLSTTPALIALYTQFGVQLKKHFTGSTAAIYSSSDELLSCLRMRAADNFKLNNGALECVLKIYPITQPITASSEAAAGSAAPDLANRLRKNSKKFTKWAKEQQLDCYRLYDADLPEYNVAIDCYKDQLVIQEYSAPSSIDPEVARRRLLDVVRTVVEVMDVSANQVILKTRTKQKGANQYQKLSQTNRFMLVQEYGVDLEVNLHDYLDTGLFLDHRLTRKWLGSMAKGKDFLNLFAYTGSASVHAAVGGARTTTTVDMSKSYLAWAQRNFEHNQAKINGRIDKEHRFIHADCLQWLEQEKGRYDLIFIDPPTFSNSKRMHDSFDVQRDHLKLLTRLKELLKPDGCIVFSNNKRHFKMDMEGLVQANLSAVSLSHKTLPFDFERNKHIHNSWLIQCCEPQ
ncbi:MAG: bifunctional 23S rRNA (guanine(2069)-N(7))-methyltransferase RlmK/23S rRNA (guanine(2445)-N(2))-methyltransferase RlmL [Vibrionaceae bacterium]